MTFDEKCSLINETRLQEFSARAAELSALEEQLGPDVSRILLQTRADSIVAEWQQIARDTDRNDIQGLLDTLWTWVKEIGFEYSYEWLDENSLLMHVTKCPIAEMAKSIDQADWGFKCYCCDDESIVKGFNPDIKFTRTKTLMEGHECCDHMYTLAK